MKKTLVELISQDPALNKRSKQNSVKSDCHPLKFMAMHIASHPPDNRMLMKTNIEKVISQVRKNYSSLTLWEF